MATCRTCKGVGSYLVQVRRGAYAKEVCARCEGGGVEVPDDLVLSPEWGPADV